MRSKLVRVIAGVLLAAVFEATEAYAQDLSATLQGLVAPNTQIGSQLSSEQLDQLLAPIALYPDELLSDILMAATYPLGVVEAARWVRDPQNASLKGDQLLEALENQDWDPSVKSLLQFPRILVMMDDELDWTERLGEAFLADQSGVMDSVQRLRQRAQSAGRLVSFPEASVTVEDQIISIAPSTPDLVYIPVYDPSVVYGDWPYPAFPPDTFPVFSDGATVVGLGCRWLSAPIVAPLWGWHHFQWRRHNINIDRDRFAVFDVSHPPIEGDTWGHDPSHRGNVQYRDPGVRARFGGATTLPKTGSAVHGFPSFPIPWVSTAPTLQGTLSREPATGGIAAERRRISPVFEPFSRNSDMRPNALVPPVYSPPPLRPNQIGEHAVETIQPSMKTQIPVATKPFGKGVNLPIRTQPAISRQTSAPTVDPREGAQHLLPYAGQSPTTNRM
jgi:hypothetical protein